MRWIQSRKIGSRFGVLQILKRDVLEIKQKTWGKILKVTKPHTHNHWTMDRVEMKKIAVSVIQYKDSEGKWGDVLLGEYDKQRQEMREADVHMSFHTTHTIYSIFRDRRGSRQTDSFTLDSDTFDTFCLYLSTPLSLCCSLFVVVFPVFVALSPVCLPASDLLQKLTTRLQQKAKTTSELQQLTIYPALQRVINQSHCSACYDDKMAGLLHFIRSSNPCMGSQTHKYRQRCLLLQSSSNILKTLRAGVVLIPDHSPAQNKHTQCERKATAAEAVINEIIP